MRFAPLLTIAAALTFAAVGVAEAQTTNRTTTSQNPKKRTYIVITQRSPLDGGTTVKPGSKSYLDYALPANYFFPNYGVVENTGVPGRYPLPSQFEIPGY